MKLTNKIIEELRTAKAEMDEGSIAGEDRLRDLLMEHADELISMAAITLNLIRK